MLLAVQIGKTADVSRTPPDPDGGPAPGFADPRFVQDVPAAGAAPAISFGWKNDFTAPVWSDHRTWRDTDIVARVAGSDAIVVVNQTTAGLQAEPVAERLSDGRVVVAWTDRGQVVPVVNGTSTVWTTVYPSDDPDSGSVRGRILNADGTFASGEFLINTGTAGNQTPERIVALDGGRFMAVWLDVEHWNNGLIDIEAQVFNADGSKSGPEFVVSQNRIGRQSEPAVKYLADGRFMIVWNDASGQGGDVSGFGIKARLFEADGLPAGDEFLVNTVAEGNQIDAQFVDRPGGGFAMTWAVPGGIAMQLFDGGGTKIGSELKLGSPGHVVWTGINRFDVVSSGGDEDLTVTTRASFVLTDGVPDPMSLDGTRGDDTLFASRFADGSVRRGLAGDDTIAGGFRDDRLEGNAGDDRLCGGGGRDTLEGGAGRDILNGGKGGDTMRGGAGDDIYRIDTKYYGEDDNYNLDPDDLTIEEAGGGRDTVISGVGGIDLENHRNVENAILVGSGDHRLSGSAAANMLKGNAGGNVVQGGEGRDVLIGGGGGDRFVFGWEGDSGSGAGRRDVIMDFTRGEDTIDVQWIGANGPLAGAAFDFLAAAAFTGNAGELRRFRIDHTEDRRDKTIVEGDIDGDGAADFQIELRGLIDLTAADFIL